MTNYSLFAYVYDDLMEFPYDEYAALIKRVIPMGDTVLDLACGTGTLINLLQKEYDWIGADLSEEMLEVAYLKNPDIPLFVHDLREPFQVEGLNHIICTVDSLNYITDYQDLKKVFAYVSENLASGSYFIFDCYTKSKLKTMDHYHFFLEDETLKFDWKSEVEGSMITHTIELTLDGEDGYEVHQEYVYDEDEIESLLQPVFTFEKEYMEDRIIYIAQKK